MVLANSTISNLFFFSYNWQIPLTYVTSQNPHKTHTVWMKEPHGKNKYSNGSMPLGSKLAMLVEWKQPRLQVSLLPFSTEKSLGTRGQWNRCSYKQTPETVPSILAICEVAPETGSDCCVELNYDTVLREKF